MERIYLLEIEKKDEVHKNDLLTKDNELFSKDNDNNMLKKDLEIVQLKYQLLVSK